MIKQIKSVLIQLYARKGDAVLDLACGKVLALDNWNLACNVLEVFSDSNFLCLDQGGDLIKWDKAEVGYYVGIDIAEGSVCFFVLFHNFKCFVNVFYSTEMETDFNQLR